MARDNNITQIARFDGKNIFVEALSSGFSIGKLQLNFVEYDDKTTKQKAKLDIYINIGTALVLANEILSGQFAEKIRVASETKTYKGEEVKNWTAYFHDMGGINEDSVKKRMDKLKPQFPWIQEGKGISRQVKIQKGFKYPYVLRAEYGLGVSDSNGLIVPKGETQKFINIPMTDEQLKELAMMIKVHYEAYLNQYYSKFGTDIFGKQSCKVFKDGSTVQVDIEYKDGRQARTENKVR